MITKASEEYLKTMYVLKKQNGNIRVTDIANKMNCTKPSVNKALNNLKEEKDLFLKLISVKGIGCKSACTMLASGDVEGICEAIESGNMTYLKKIPGIGPKAAGQIILDLQGKVTATKQTVVNQELEEAMEVLIALGYKQSEVDKVVKKLTDENLDTNGYVKKALSLIVK